MHEEWTDKLSDYLDGELPPGERAEVDGHLRTCSECTAVLNDLKRIVVQAQALDARPPLRDLWPGVAGRIEKIAAPRRISFTLPQFAAAAIVLMAVSGTIAIRLIAPAMVTETAGTRSPVAPSTAVAGSGAPGAGDDRGSRDLGALPVSLADAQYDAAVADLEKALNSGRGRLDKATIEIVEHNLQIIDQAIAQARDALAADPANTYLSGHLVETRRRKLDLLRRAAALAETD
jgi:hypothetical protein